MTEPTTVELLHRIWRRTIQSHNHDFGPLYYLAVNHVRDELKAKRDGYELPSMRGPKIPYGSMRARLSTLPARCAAESAKLEGVTRQAA